MDDTKLKFLDPWKSRPRLGRVQFFFSKRPFKYRVDLIPEQLSPQNTPRLLSSAVHKPIQKHFHTISSMCHFVCHSNMKMWFFLTFTWMIQALKSLRCSRYTYQEMAPLYLYSKTPHDGNCLNTISGISLTLFQHFLLLHVQMYHLFAAFSLLSAFSLSLRTPEPLSLWQVTKMSPLTRWSAFLSQPLENLWKLWPVTHFCATSIKSNTLQQCFVHSGHDGGDELNFLFQTPLTESRLASWFKP